MDGHKVNDIFDIDWGNLQLLPAGNYEAVYVSHETFNQSFGAKVKITFRITSHGQWFGSHINGWYNVKALISKPGKHRKVLLSRHSKLTIELLNVLDIKEKVSRLSPVQLKGKLLEIAIRTVRMNSRQKAYAEIQTYSVVDRIVRLLSDDRTKLSKPLPKPIPEPIPTSKPASLSKIMPAGMVCTDSLINLALEKGM
jgi:hypothetical protein